MEHIRLTTEFENYVNYAGSKTPFFLIYSIALFENYVNYAGSKTRKRTTTAISTFENYVNYAGSKTGIIPQHGTLCLRTM